MNFSMMSKAQNKLARFCAFLLIAVFMFSFFPKTTAKAETPVKYDVLFTYDDGTSIKNNKDIAAAADILTYLGYSVCYRDVNSAASMVKDFNYIVFYHETDTSNYEFINNLKSSKAKIFTFGGGNINDYTEALGVPLKCRKASSSPVSVDYVFRNKLKQTLTEKNKTVSPVVGDADYTSGNLTVNGEKFPLCVRTGRFTNLSVFSSEQSILKAIFTKEIATWKWPYDNTMHSYAQYIVFNDVYPFCDPQKIEDVVDIMKENHLPFVITVMPIYKNGDFPAMRRFCEALTYAQANDGAIALKEPKINGNDTSLAAIDKAIAESFSIYTKNGVYPVALETNESSIHSEKELAVMRRFRTVLLEKSDGASSFTFDEKRNDVYKDGHQIISPALTANGVNGLVSDYPTMVTLDINKSLDSIKDDIAAIKSSSMPLMSIFSSPQSVYTDDSYLKYENDAMVLNGKPVSLQYKKFTYSKNFDYHESLFSDAIKNMSGGNKKLLIMVSIISAIFIALIIMARIQNRRKFIVKRKSGGK